ncbi:methyltransferase NSUN6 [Marchantia polymorpha subsp. ruderalis]|uniref:SAM-dependent MTase RsmB/NOP-type domain-containing protein n=1 Tax=Marchantia polymorpha TaxID=3197 RepID=A0A2R6XB17_MARPO|nr:hypothetical protein MARPO_0025s0011 [Marchantia polymorpha]BBN03828.1 hypothetical protein Mp_2g26730 [Marchantia polymorpha subsp. ruderalis]|eukprot:PTQ43306.1 hypothetical protein MARPO_0025s0011 [Marchantia polymorpha]
MEGREKRSPGYGFRPKLMWNTGVQEYLTRAYGAKQFDAICDALMRPCINSTLRVNTLQASTPEVIEQLYNVFRKNSMIMGTHRVGSQVQGLDESGQKQWLNSNTEGANASAEPNVEIGPNFPSNMTLKDGSAASTILESRESIDDKYRRVSAEFPDFSCWEHPVLKDVVMVGGRGPCEVDCRGEAGASVKEVVVSRKCAEAVLRGANVFVPGVLACSQHLEEGDVVAVTVAVERPDGGGGWSVGITRGTTLESEHAVIQMEGSTRSNYFIGMGRMMMSRTALFREIKGVAVEMTKRIFDLPPFHGVLEGQIFLQNLPSIVAARVLDPKPGERILDMCAAPGGKTTAIGILMKDRGEVIALDRSHNKVSDIKNLADEMKLNCIQAYKLDATKSVTQEPHIVLNGDTISPSKSSSDSTTANFSQAQIDSIKQPRHVSMSNKQSGTTTSSLSPYEIKAAARKELRRMKNRLASDKAALQRIKSFQPQSFDRVLLDAPCSALGLRPRLFAGEETLETLRQHSCYQRKLLDQAVKLVRPGGTLVYSTCTLNPGENEAVVRYALDTYHFLSLMPQEPRIGGPGLVGGLDVFDGMSYKEWLREGEKHLVQRFSPGASYDTIGFFIAKFSVSLKMGQSRDDII